MGKFTKFKSSQPNCENTSLTLSVNYVCIALRLRPRQSLVAHLVDF